MKANVMFDTLAYANKLKAAGVDPKAAEAQAEVNAEMITTLLESTLATKQDLTDMSVALTQDITHLRAEFTQNIIHLRSELKQDMAALRAELKQDTADLRAELKQDIGQLETRLTLRLGGIMVGTMTVATTILSVLHFVH